MRPCRGTSLAPRETAGLLDPASGELLERTPENAAALLERLRALRGAIAEAVRACEAVLLEESERLGTKTLHVGGVVAVASQRRETVWDVEALRAGLEKAGCPPERLVALIVETVEYKVDGSVARQLAAANPAYARVIERAKTVLSGAKRVSVR